MKRGLPKGIIAVNEGFCKRCGAKKDLRFGICFDCATQEEKDENIRQLARALEEPQK